MVSADKSAPQSHSMKYPPLAIFANSLGSRRGSCLIFEIRANIETTNTPIFCNNVQHIVGFYLKARNSHWSGPLIGNGEWFFAIYSKNPVSKCYEAGNCRRNLYYPSV